MKRLFITLSILAVTLSMVSCNLLGEPKQETQTQESTAAPVQNPNEIRIYSNAFDGFVNIRQAPTTKSKIIGRLNNGNDYLVQVGIQGKWTIVMLQDQIGYVSSAIVGYTPWKPVTLGIDADWIEGAYECCVSIGDWGLDLLVFNNGKFAITEGAYAQFAYGTWKFEGADIVLTVKKDLQGHFNYGQEMRYPVDVINSSINGCRKNTYYSSFASIKKTVNHSVRLK